MNIFKKIISKQDYNQFKLYSIAALLMGNLFSIFYLVTEVKNNNFVEKYLVTIAKMNNFDYESLEPNVLNEMKLIVMSTLSVSLLSFMIFNIIVYYFFYKDKQWAISFVRFLSYTSLFLTFVAVFQAITHFSFTQLLNIFSIPLYIYVIVGLDHFKKSKNEESQSGLPEDLPKNQ